MVGPMLSTGPEVFVDVLVAFTLGAGARVGTSLTWVPRLRVTEGGTPGPVSVVPLPCAASTIAMHARTAPAARRKTASGRMVTHYGETNGSLILRPCLDECHSIGAADLETFRAGGNAFLYRNSLTYAAKNGTIPEGVGAARPIRHTEE
jgi:hypothetical protein